MGLLSNWLHNYRTQLIKSQVAGDVLDLGCGPASNLILSSDNISSYYGIEYNQSTVDELNIKYPDAKFFQKDIDKDAYDFGVIFDRVLLIAVIEHVFNQKHLFEQILKVLKPDGKIIITTPTVFGNDLIHRIGGKLGVFSKDASEDHINIFNRMRFQILAKEFNLRIEKYRRFQLGCNQLVTLAKNS